MRVPHRNIEIKPSNLDDPVYAAHAWGRYKRLMGFMFAFNISAVLLILGYIYVSDPSTSIHFFIAAGIGMTAAMMLAAALMGLVFLSNGTGHDAAVDDRIDYEANDESKR